MAKLTKSFILLNFKLHTIITIAACILQSKLCKLPVTKTSGAVKPVPPQAPPQALAIIVTSLRPSQLLSTFDPGPSAVPSFSTIHPPSTDHF
jgi:hypothetical protein